MLILFLQHRLEYQAIRTVCWKLPRVTDQAVVAHEFFVVTRATYRLLPPALTVFRARFYTLECLMRPWRNR